MTLRDLISLVVVIILCIILLLRFNALESTIKEMSDIEVNPIVSIKVLAPDWGVYKNIWIDYDIDDAIVIRQTFPSMVIDTMFDTTWVYKAEK